MNQQVSIICENTVGRPLPVRAEHGFAALIETDGGRWLFDTGSGSTLLDNLVTLGHDPHSIDGVILSHGHYDHAGGLLPLLQQIGSRPVYCHPGVFTERAWQGLHEERDIGMPHTRDLLEAAGARFIFSEAPLELSKGLFFSGSIGQRDALESGDPHLVCRQAREVDWSADRFPDDAALALETGRGLVIILGCAHAGLISSVEHLLRLFPGRRVHAIVGGTHLGPASDAQFEATVDYLLRLDFDRLGVSHCTGQIRAAQLYARFPNKVFFANVGTTLKV